MARPRQGLTADAQPSPIMPLISTDNSCCTVIVTVDAPADLRPRLEAHAHMGLQRFSDFPGYLGGALHVSDDGGRLVQYLQWASQEEYRACIDDASWDDLPSTADFMEAVRSGGAVVDARTFTVVAS